MRIGNLKTKAAAVLLCAAVAVGGLATAAGAFDVGAPCSVEVGRDMTMAPPDDLPDELKDDYFTELEITTGLYRLADVDENYAYTALPAYAALDLTDLAKTSIEGAEGDAPSAERLHALCEQALAITLEAEVAPTASADYPASERVTIDTELGGGKLRTGLYLMYSTAVDHTGRYVWTAAPALLALPCLDEQNVDSFDLKGVNLKLSHDYVMTSLRIIKKLPTYSATQGPATFVFQVEAVMPNGRTVYSDVFSLVFGAGGVKEKVIDKLPVGARVTVTEVYSGATYTAEGSAMQTIELKPLGEDGTMQEVGFENSYDERRRGGSSITNAFHKDDDGHWGYEQTPSDTMQNAG